MKVYFIMGLLGFFVAIMMVLLLGVAIYDFVITWQGLNMVACSGIIMFIIFLIGIIAMFIFSIALMKINK